MVVGLVAVLAGLAVLLVERGSAVGERGLLVALARAVRAAWLRR